MWTMDYRFQILRESKEKCYPRTVTESEHLHGKRLRKLSSLRIETIATRFIPRASIVARPVGVNPNAIYFARLLAVLAQAAQKLGH